MDQIRDCKRLHAQGMSIRRVSEDLGISRNTVRAYLRGEREPGVYIMNTRRRQPVKDRIRSFVLDLLKTEKALDAPRKQRLTAGRVKRLLEEAGLKASGSTVRSLVRELRLELRDPLDHAFIPLAYDPGRDAQVDFFEGIVILPDGGRQKVHILLMRACYSGRSFAYAAPNQTREALLEGLMQAFEFFGGVFQNVWFDNLTPAVRKVLKGRTRKLQKAFACFQAHYGFKAEFCSPGKGNEKGGVENEVKYSRSEILTPLPTVTSREDVQALCDAWMARDASRTRRGQERSNGELFQDEVGHLIPLPRSRFEAARVRIRKVSPRSWISVGTNQYSVPVDWVGHEVEVKLKAESVLILHKDHGAVEHKRLYVQHRMSVKLEHYLPLLRRKCRGLDRSVPFRQWIDTVDPCWRSLLQALRSHLGETEGSREFVDIVTLCRVWSESKVTGAVRRTLRHPEVSLATVRFFLRQDEGVSPKRETSINYAGPKVSRKSTAQYMVLCGEGGSEHV